MRPISIEAYHVFLELGAADRRTELLRNVIVEKTTKSPLHEYLASKLFELARAAAGLGRSVCKEGPLTLVDSEPEPDVSIFEGTMENFRVVHPSSALLAMEIAVSAEEVDREKIGIYAEAAVAEYWLVLPASSGLRLDCSPARERRDAVIRKQFWRKV